MTPDISDVKKLLDEINAAVSSYDPILKEKARDLLGRTYEYFLSGFAGAEGRRGASFSRRVPLFASWSRC